MSRTAADHSVLAELDVKAAEAALGVAYPQVKDVLVHCIGGRNRHLGQVS